MNIVKNNQLYSKLVMIIIAACIAGCSDSQLITDAQLDSTINGKSIVVYPNQKIVLELDVNADGGYSWACDIANPKIAVLDSTHCRPKNNNPNIDGGLTVETFYFRGITSGQSSIKLFEHRSWEKDIPAINIIQFNVTVR